MEIPFRDKNRYVVVRETAGPLIVLDDFVSGSASNIIRLVKLEKQKLLYYDAGGNVIREKQL